MDPPAPLRCAAAAMPLVSASEKAKTLSVVVGDGVESHAHRAVQPLHQMARRLNTGWEGLHHQLGDAVGHQIAHRRH